MSFLRTRSFSFSDEDVENARDWPTTPTKRRSNTKQLLQLKQGSNTVPATPNFMEVDSGDENVSPDAVDVPVGIPRKGRSNCLSIKAAGLKAAISSRQQLQTITPPMTPTRRTSPRTVNKSSKETTENCAPYVAPLDFNNNLQKTPSTPKRRIVANNTLASKSPSNSSNCNNTTGLTPAINRMLKPTNEIGDGSLDTRANKGGYSTPTRLSRAKRSSSSLSLSLEQGGRPSISRSLSTISTISSSSDHSSKATSPVPAPVATPATTALGYYQDAKTLFRRTTEPHRLVGRAAEREAIRAFCQDHMLAPKAGSLYISGQPGTGKTALLKEIMRDMEPEMKKAEHEIKVVTINCMTVKDPRLVYGKILDALDRTLETAGDRDAAVKAVESLVLGGRKKIMYVTILDEIDQLLTKDQDVLYKLFQWSCNENSKLTLVGIANALDMTDRFLPRLKAKNCEPQLLHFNPYQVSEIKEIIMDRLFSLESNDDGKDSESEDAKLERPRMAPLMQRPAIELCARKVAAATGDLRKALDICRHAIEMVEVETKKKQQHQQHQQQSNEKRPLELQQEDATSNKRLKIMPLQEISLADLENRIAGGQKVSLLRSRSAPVSPLPSPTLSRSSSFLDEPSPFHEPAVTSTSTSGSATTAGAMMTIQQAPKVTVEHVKRALASAFGSPMVQKMKALNVHQKIVLAVLVMKIQAGKTVDCDVGKVFDHYTVVCRGSNKIGAVNRGEYQDLINMLEANGLVTLSKAKEERLRKVGLVPRETEVVEGIRGQDILDMILAKAGIKSAEG